MDMNQATNKMEETAESVNRMGETAKAKLSDVSNKVVERSRAAATSTDAYVHEYAWSSVAIAALLGVVVGLMIRRP
jgi:ElaB/YqjD/DUF883 family membrane-anchored ribosome-binding protein